MACNRCGSWAINHGHHGRDGSEPNLCDVCYWRQRCEQCTASNAAKVAEIARLREALIDCIPALEIGLEAAGVIGTLGDGRPTTIRDALKQARAALAPAAEVSGG